MSNIVNIVWDATDGHGEIICVADNDHDVLRFILAHNDIYPWLDGVEQDVQKLWNDILEKKVDVQDLSTYFEGIEVETRHIGYDYAEEIPLPINEVADKVGVDEFGIK